MKQTYRVLVRADRLGVLVQAAAIAFGWFDAITDVENGLVIDENYELQPRPRPCTASSASTACRRSP